jgi:excisionase family DNA binding protein
MTVLLMSPHEAAKMIGVSVKTLLGYVHDGRISYVNIGRGDRRPRYAFADCDIAEFEQAGRRRNAARAIPCQSTSRKAVRSTSSISSAEVIAFTAQQSVGLGAKRKR